VIDTGTTGEERVDYPDFARAVAQAVASRRAQKGILVCSTGIGMSIAANRVRGVRAALCHNLTTARRSREHNDANVLCLGADIVPAPLARNMVRLWLATPFAGGRHRRRLASIDSDC
jgi:ribose 5-phosphate isomerase B